MYKCNFCDKKYTSKRSLSFHTKRTEKQKFENEIDLIRYLCNEFYGKTKTDSLLKQYIEKEICTHDLSKKYDYIIQLITSMGIKRTNSEEKQTERYKRKYLTKIQSKYGKNITNISQVETIKEKKRNTIENKYNSYEEYHSTHIRPMKEGYKKYCSNSDNMFDRKTKIKDTLEKKYGVSNPSQIPEVREKISNARKQEMSLLTEEEKRLRTQKAREAIKYESSLEIRVKKCLVELEEDFLQHQFLWGYNFDILLRDKILIEVNGDFWHANPLIYSNTDVLLGDLTASKIWNKDKKKLDKATNKGYTVITIWESEIRSKCDSELTETIKKRIENVRCSK
jgi:G:T-mismatch repair DNA endonuclease (very short patch repair protein)